MLIWLMSHLYALPRRPGSMTGGSRPQSPRFVPVRVLPTPASLAPRPSTWPDRHVSRGHKARPETDDMRHPVYQIGTNIRRTYSAARVVRQEAESHSVTNAGRAPPCEIRRYARPASRHRFQLKGAYQALCEPYGSQCHPRDRGLAADEDKAIPAFGEDHVRGYGRSACSVTRTIMLSDFRT